MISYRLRGLIQLHVVAAAGLMTAYFIALALAVPRLRFIDLSPDVNILLYALPTLIGMLLGGRFWVGYTRRFHAVSWIDAAAVTSRQILTVALLIFALIVGTKDRSVSRLFLAFYLVSGSFLLLWINRRLPQFLARIAFQENNRIPALFVGPTRALGRLNTWMRQKEHLGIQPVGIVSDDTHLNGSACGLKHLGAVAQLREIVEERNVRQVILLEVPQPQEMVAVLETCQATGSRLLVYPNFADRLPIPMVPVMEDEHLFLTAHDEPLEDPFNRGLKRVLDIAVSLPVVVFILPPLCLLVWLMQAIQAPGPLMFRRPRGGQRGRSFDMLKFRSMYVHDPALESRQARKGDPRIYPFGAFLRKTSLDEFPQFVNVLVGSMSLVGPRPHLPQHDTEFSTVAKTYRTRQLVKPGITGLAQVSGLRGEITDPDLLHERVKKDIEYITTWTLWLDLQITAKTLLQVIVPPSSAR